MIWFKEYKMEDALFLGKGNMLEHLGITITEAGENFLKGKMPVDHRTIQPMGLLHGGASVALAESLGSIAAAMVIDPEKYYCVGLEINANHLRSVSDGFVYGTAKPIHIGGKTHVWNIEITNEENKMVCISRLTMAILERK
jgi:1,4-dihydroxy-2-naphthoyl-CoA hydrolase